MDGRLNLCLVHQQQSKIQTTRLRRQLLHDQIPSDDISHSSRAPVHSRYIQGVHPRLQEQKTGLLRTRQQPLLESSRRAFLVLLDGDKTLMTEHSHCIFRCNRMKLVTICDPGTFRGRRPALPPRRVSGKPSLYEQEAHLVCHIR